MKLITFCFFLILSSVCLAQDEINSVNMPNSSIFCTNSQASFFAETNGVVYMAVSPKSDCSYMMSMDEVTEQLMEGLRSAMEKVCSLEFVPQTISVSVGLVSATWEVNKPMCDKFKSK